METPTHVRSQSGGVEASKATAKKGTGKEREGLGDLDLLDRFESLRLPVEDFSHTEHVRLTWLYLERWPLAEALVRMGEGTRRFAKAHGAPGKYHETITWAWVLLIHERRMRDQGHEDGPAQEWAAFAARHPDLLTRGAALLARYYRPETLASDLARATFLLPDQGMEGGVEGELSPLQSFS